jgi:hypothetical protein
LVRGAGEYLARHGSVSPLIERQIFWNCIHRNNRVPKQSEVIRVVSNSWTMSAPGR